MTLESEYRQEISFEILLANPKKKNKVFFSKGFVAFVTQIKIRIYETVDIHFSTCIDSRL